jgi:hypothetical protein
MLKREKDRLEPVPKATDGLNSTRTGKKMTELPVRLDRIE